MRKIDVKHLKKWLFSSFFEQFLLQITTNLGPLKTIFLETKQNLIYYFCAFFKVGANMTQTPGSFLCEPDLRQALNTTHALKSMMPPALRGRVVCFPVKQLF
jgi:hypothetical protein